MSEHSLVRGSILIWLDWILDNIVLYYQESRTLFLVPYDNEEIIRTEFLGFEDKKEEN